MKDNGDERWVEHYPNGQLWKEGTLKDGKKHGPYVRYYPNGQLWLKGAFKDGKKHGPYVAYDYNGQLKSEGTWCHETGMELRKE